MSSCETRLDEFDDKINVLGYRSLDLEARSRRKNLIFRGLFEFRDENCVDRIYEFLYDMFGIAAERVVIERAHRLGPWKRAVRKRPIIVAFRDYSSTELILNEAFQLRGTRFSIDKDYPAEIAKARRLLWNRYKQLKITSRETVKMVYPAKIIVGRKVVEDAFPGWNSILKSERVEPVISEAVEKLNKECEEARNKERREYGGSASDPVTGQGHHDSRGADHQSAMARNSYAWDRTADNSRPESRASHRFSGSENMQSGSRVNTGEKHQEKRRSNDTCIEMESCESDDGAEDDEDEDDRVFYSDYVSRMDKTSDRNNTNGKTPKKQQESVTPRSPQIITMKDFPLLCPASPANVSNQSCNSKSNGNNSNSSGAKRPSEKTMKADSVTSDRRDPVSVKHNRDNCKSTNDTSKTTNDQNK